MALWESLTVATVGVMVGTLAAGGAIVGVTIAVSRLSAPVLMRYHGHSSLRLHSPSPSSTDLRPYSPPLP